MNKFILIVLILLGGISSPLQAQPLLVQSRHEMNARVVGFDSAYVLRVLQFNRIYKVKLLGLQVPAAEQKEARYLEQYLAQQVIGQVVGVRSSKRLPRGVLLAEVMLHGKSLNHQLIKKGLCYPALPLTENFPEN